MAQKRGGQTGSGSFAQLQTARGAPFTHWQVQAACAFPVTIAPANKANKIQNLTTMPPGAG